MLWVIRAGKNSMYYDKFLESDRIYLSWEGYKTNLQDVSDIASLRELVEREKKTTNKTSVSNWAGQINAFVNEMDIGDYVLIPTKGSKTYTLATIAGNYMFDETDIEGLYHSRKIQIEIENITKALFTQPIIYSLGAYRTLFKAKREKEILAIIAKEYQREKSNEITI